MTRPRALFAALFVAFLLHAQPSTPLGIAGDGWYGWKVPVRGQSICCNRCSLDGDRGFSINRHDDDDISTTSEMLIAVRVEAGRIRKVKLFDSMCKLETNGHTLHMLNNVTPDASIDYLLSQIRNADREGELLAALSLHDHPRVVPALISLARNDPDTDVRAHAIFWLGQKAGAKVAGELRRSVDEDPDEDVKERAVFAISQLPRDRSVPMLIDLVKTHKNRKVRERSMFWLAQTSDPRALDLIESILMQ